MDYRIKYTALGLAKLAAAEAAAGHIVLTHIAVGDAAGVYYELAETPVMLALVNEVWRGPIDQLYIDPADPTQIVIEAPLPPGNGPFDLREGGAFDSDGDLILVWLMPLTNVPALAEGSSKDLRLRVFRKVTNAALFTLILDVNIASASRGYVDLALVEAGYGTPVTLAVESTLSGAHGTVFLNPADGATVLFHLPVYASVSARKRYKIKNIGQGIATLDTTDVKTIDTEAIMDLAPGDRCELAKDGTNWQTI